jgi:hypothetical protein
LFCPLPCAPKSRTFTIPSTPAVSYAIKSTLPVFRPDSDSAAPASRPNALR